MLELEEQIFRARALIQGHPLSPRCYRYLNEMVARERTSQPTPELGIWAGHGLTAGWCLRRLEETDTDGRLRADGSELPQDLDEAATQVAGRIRSGDADEYLLYPEERVVDALDHMIAGEIDRRLSHWEGTVDEDTWAELEEYVAWWVIKGYALRVVDGLLPDEVGAVPGPEAADGGAAGAGTP